LFVCAKSRSQAIGNSDRLRAFILAPVRMKVRRLLENQLISNRAVRGVSPNPPIGRGGVALHILTTTNLFTCQRAPAAVSNGEHRMVATPSRVSTLITMETRPRSIDRG